MHISKLLTVLGVLGLTLHATDFCTQAREDAYPKWRDSRLDDAKVATAHEQRANDGNVASQAILASLYICGIGVAKDASKARSWAEKAANRNNAKGEFILGLLYENGEGVPKNLERAVVYYNVAASHGDPMAKDNLDYLLSEHPNLSSVLSTRRSGESCTEEYIRRSRYGNSEAVREYNQRLQREIINSRNCAK